MRLAFLVIMGVAILLSACASEPTLSPTDAPPAREATPTVEATIPSPTVGTVPAATATPTPDSTPSRPPVLTPTPRPTATPTPAPTATLSSTPKPTPTLLPPLPPGVLVPLDLQDPQSLLPALSEAELTCIGFEPEKLARVLAASGTQPREEQARLLDCLEDETIAGLFLAGFVPGPGTLSAATSDCIRAAFEVIDPRAVMTSGIEGNPGVAMASSMAAFSVTTACLNDEEWDMAGPAMGIRPDERTGMQCLLVALGGPGPMAAAMVATQQGDFTALTDAGLACGLDLGTPPGQANVAPPLPPSAAPTATPAPTAAPTATPPPTATPTPTPSVNPALANYSPLLAEAASTLPAEYDFVSDGLSAEERDILDWADTRLFSNPAFLASKWGPDNWPVAVSGQGYPESKFTPKDPLSGEELQVASVQALVLMMMAIDIDRRSNGRHVISWQADSLDRVLDGVNVYQGLCVHCYGKTGYDTREGIRENYGPLIWEVGHGHREMLKAFAYYAKADGEGILVRSFMDNSANDMELLHKRGRWHSPIAVGSFNNENISFMSQIRLPDGTLQSYPTLAFSMVGNVDSERQAVERIYDYMRKNLIHVTGGDARR